MRDLRLGVRLGLAFGLLLAALAVISVVSVGKLRSLDASSTNTAQGKVIAAQQQLGVLQHGFQANAHNTVRHLYVYDGDLKAQDAVAADVAKVKAEIGKSLSALEAVLVSDGARDAYGDIVGTRKTYVAAFSEALKLSRQETIDEVEERDGSRTVYTERVVPALKALDGKLATLSAALADDTRAATTAAADRAKSGERTILLVGILAAIIAIALAVLTTRSIVRPVDRLAAALRRVQEQDLRSLQGGLEALSRGDLTVSVEPTTEPIGEAGKDEIGRAGRTVDAVVAQAHASIDAYNVGRGKLADMISGAARSAAGVSAASQQMAETASEAGRAVGEIASAMSDLARGAERQVQAVDSARRGADEVGERIGHSVTAAQETADAADSARAVAQEGVEAARRATAAMEQVSGASEAVTGAIRDLAGKSEEIAGIVQTITAIAEQTNLLALNAAIEAARAGEQGRGFAVVAEEVRKLAEEAQRSATQIAGLLSEIQGQTQAAVELVEDGTRQTQDGTQTVAEARNAFERIGAAVESMSGQIAEIAAAAQLIAAETGTVRDHVTDMAAVAEQASASAEQVSASTEETSASTQEIAASAQQLAATSSELEALVGRFRV
jgi:methyl-accepting chemotaxis protein